jgi:hypothetical protein
LLLVELLEELRKTKDDEIAALTKCRDALRELNVEKEAYVELLKYCINLCEELKYTNRALYIRMYNKLSTIVKTREEALLDDSL